MLSKSSNATTLGRAIESWPEPHGPSSSVRLKGGKRSGEGVAKSEWDSKYCLATIYEMLEDKMAEAEPLLRAIDVV